MILLPASFFGYSFSRNSADKGVIEKEGRKKKRKEKEGERMGGKNNSLSYLNGLRG